MKKIVEEAKELLQLVEKFGLQEIELETEGLKFRATRASAAQPVPAATRFEAPTPVVALAAPEAVAVAPLAAPVPAVMENTVAIASPMVGIFYRSSGPAKPPFVQDGSTVEPETTVCIIEAMKLMNEIKAGVRGVVVACPVDNETPVKAGQALFLVRPS